MEEVRAEGTRYNIRNVCVKSTTHLAVLTAGFCTVPATLQVVARLHRAVFPSASLDERVCCCLLLIVTGVL